MNTSSVPVGRMVVYGLALFFVWAVLQQVSVWRSPATAAEGTAPKPAPAEDPQHRLTEAQRRAESALAEREKTEPPARTEPAPLPLPKTPRLLELYEKGGILMYPITLLSLVVVCFGLERFLGLRRGAVVPRRLVTGLRRLAAQPGGLDPGPAQELCARYDSAAGSVFRAMLSKVGRPDSEIEQAVTAANEREASRLYHHVRWLNMSMSVAPMLGLLGTVQGMILVFIGASQLPVGANKAAFMAEGIYLKLVCTFAGLVVAIPAAVLSYYFEARIQRLLGEVEDLAMELVPRLKRFEERRRRRSDPSSPSGVE